MGKRVDFEAKTDRELLILTAQATNEISKEVKTLNGTVKENQRLIAHNTERITIIETEREKDKPINNPTLMSKMLSTGKNYGTPVVVIGAFCTAVYYVGCAFGWWG